MEAVNGYRPAQRQFTRIYVSNLIDESKEPGRQRNGTYEDPFAQLSDALVRAEEVIAMFSNLVTVEVFLYKGEHFLLENRFDALNIYHKKLTSDDFAVNQNLVVRPLDCWRKTYDLKAVNQSICTQPGEKVTVYNKIRERLNFKVLASLRLERVIIDSLDSILPLGHPCLSERRQCCQVVTDDEGFPEIREADPSRAAGCVNEFSELKLNDNCNVGQPRSLFTMVTNKQTPIAQELQVQKNNYL